MKKQLTALISTLMVGTATLGVVSVASSNLLAMEITENTISREDSLKALTAYLPLPGSDDIKNLYYGGSWGAIHPHYPPEETNYNKQLRALLKGRDLQDLHKEVMDFAQKVLCSCDIIGSLEGYKNTLARWHEAFASPESTAYPEYIGLTLYKADLEVREAQRNAAFFGKATQDVGDVVETIKKFSLFVQKHKTMMTDKINEKKINEYIENIVNDAINNYNGADVLYLLNETFDQINKTFPGIQLYKDDRKIMLYQFIKESLSSNLEYFQKSRQEHLNAIRKKTDEINEKTDPESRFAEDMRKLINALNKSNEKTLYFPSCDRASDMDYYDNFTSKFFPDREEENEYRKKWHQGFRKALVNYETSNRDEIMKTIISNHADVGVSNFGNITKGAEFGLSSECGFPMKGGGYDGFYDTNTLWTAFYLKGYKSFEKDGVFKLHITALPWSATRVAQVSMLVLFGKLTLNELAKHDTASIGQYLEELWDKESETFLKNKMEPSYGITCGKILSTLIEMRGLYATKDLRYNYPTKEANYSTQAGKFLVFYSQPNQDSELLKLAKDLDDVFGLLLGLQYFEKGDFLPLKGDAQLGISGAVYCREDTGDRAKPLAIMMDGMERYPVKKMEPLFVGQPIFWMDSLVYAENESISTEFKKFIDFGFKVEVKLVD